MWNKILFATAKITLPVWLTCMLVCWYLDGKNGFLSAGFGGAVVLIFSALTLLVGQLFWNKWPSKLLLGFVISYLAKIIIFPLVLTFIGRPDWLVVKAFFFTALISILVWSVAESLAFMNQRRPYFDREPHEKP
ncbi:MAG: hypothetical protein QM613_05655 [Micrococcaceae bacterium]